MQDPPIPPRSHPVCRLCLQHPGPHLPPASKVRNESYTILQACIHGRSSPCILSVCQGKRLPPYSQSYPLTRQEQCSQPNACVACHLQIYSRLWLVYFSTGPSSQQVYPTRYPGACTMMNCKEGTDHKELAPGEKSDMAGMDPEQKPDLNDLAEAAHLVSAERTEEAEDMEQGEPSLAENIAQPPADLIKGPASLNTGTTTYSGIQDRKANMTAIDMMSPVQAWDEAILLWFPTSFPPRHRIVLRFLVTNTAGKSAIKYLVICSRHDSKLDPGARNPEFFTSKSYRSQVST